jgi:hypothetical protein
VVDTIHHRLRRPRTPSVAPRRRRAQMSRDVLCRGRFPFLVESFRIQDALSLPQCIGGRLSEVLGRS